jgi:hypothetical protein
MCDTCCWCNSISNSSQKCTVHSVQWNNVTFLFHYAVNWVHLKQRCRKRCGVFKGNGWQRLGTHTSLDFYLIIEQLLFRSLLWKKMMTFVQKLYSGSKCVAHAADVIQYPTLRKVTLNTNSSNNYCGQFHWLRKHGKHCQNNCFSAVCFEKKWWPLSKSYIVLVNNIMSVNITRK